MVARRHGHGGSSSGTEKHRHGERDRHRQSTYFNAARNLINHILDSLLITSDQAFSPMTPTDENAESKNARTHSNNKEMVNR